MNSASKSAGIKLPDLPRFCKSSFTLTFVVEVVGIDVWHDCNEGIVELGPIAQGVKIQYNLYPGQFYDLDIVIWPHVAKVYCGTNSVWVRNWQFLERRWLTFSIQHVFPIRVADLRLFTATVTPHYGLGVISANSKTETKNNEVYLPPLAFGERRQFGIVRESETPLLQFIKELIWKLVEVFIPMSFLDGPFDTPYPVADVRHQDAALYNVRQIILNRQMQEVDKLETVIEEIPKGKKDGEKKKNSEVQKVKFEINLSGNSIMAGTGRVIPFQIIGDRPTEAGEVIALISSTNLPAQDDLPVVFVNVGKLTDIPVELFKKYRITHIYTRWRLSEEEHSSEQQSLYSKQPEIEIDFDDHHSVPLSCNVALDIMATFLDEPFKVELRGIRIPPPIIQNPNFFGYERTDRDFGMGAPYPLPNLNTDILIAHTKIDTGSLSKVNGFIRGDFPLYPPEVSVVSLEREEICTNDINAVRAKIKPDLIVQPGDILESQMMLHVSMGLVGCKPKSNSRTFSRLYCLVSDSEAIMSILRQITEINDSVLQSTSRDDLLTGFALDTGDTVILYVEGPRDGQILHIWEMTADFYPQVNPVFSTSAKYRSRLYPELLLSAMSFNIMKMFVPLAVILALTPIYARPALPIRTRSAVLKIGRLVASKLTSAPLCSAMPTAMELKSFRLEFCVAPRPPPVTITEIYAAKIKASGEGQPNARPSLTSASRINWEKEAV